MSTEETTIPLLSVEPLPSYDPTIGRWLWLLEDTRRETLESLSDLSPSMLDWTPAQDINSIGTLLYHMAIIEMDWLFVEILENRTLPPEVEALFPLAHRDGQSQLSRIEGVPLDEHLNRLALVRKHLLGAFHAMSVEEFRRLRIFPDYHVSAEWVLHHLIQHEVEHRGHIQLLCSWAEHKDTPS